LLFYLESESDGEPEIKIIEEEVEKVVIDEDGNEKTVTVTVQKEVVIEPSEKKKDGEPKKKHKDKDKGDKDKDKEKPEKKDKKHKEKSKSKSEKDGDEKEGKKSSKKDKEKTGYGTPAYGKDSTYGKDSKKEKKKLTADTIGDMPEVVNLTRRLDAVENGLKGLRNIVDSMVNQVDFGDGVGEILKAQLDQVQQQIATVELIPKDEPKESKKKKKGKKGAEEVPQTGIITEGEALVGGPAAGQAVVGSGGVITGAPGAPAGGVLPVVIPPPSQRDTGKAGRMPSRKDARKGGVALKGAGGNRPDSQDGEKQAPIKKRTTLKDLQIKKKAREEGVSVEEIEAREAEKEQHSKDNKGEKDKEDKKDKKDDDADETSSMESLDSEEEQAAMDEMIMEEIEAALENAADDPEAQAYALRLSLEQMNNMKKSISQSHDEFRKDMDKNKQAISQIARELSLFRAARKAQVHHSPCFYCPS
jgi:hypothetical protein